ELLQQDPEHVVLYAGSQPACLCQRDATGPHAAPDMAGYAEAEAQPHLQPSGKLPLLLWARHHPRARSRESLSVPPSTVRGDLDLSGNIASSVPGVRALYGRPHDRDADAGD